MTNSQTVVHRLIEALSEGAVMTGSEISERAVSYWNSSPKQAKALVRPRSTEEVQAALKICHDFGQSVITQGGMTGCVEGADSSPENVILSLERMTQIEDIDEIGGTATVQAGTVLQTFQETVQERGLYFPLDLGARGSCTIGGNAATNAGGINVIRYGMMRNLILGLEAILADGTIVSSMNHMLKNNTGYDLKQLFIGSEGTLGVITKVVVKLERQPASRVTAMTALPDFAHVTKFLGHCQKELGGMLTAFEVMWGDHYRAVTEPGWNKSPMDRSHEFYVLVECEGLDSDADSERFETVMASALEKEIIQDAVLPKSEKERRELWEVRENFEAVLQNDPALLYDVSLPIRNMSAYVEEVQQGLKKQWPQSACYVLGHIGDGNLHLFIAPNSMDADLHGRSDELVYGPLAQYGGSVSAEHGIGTEKKKWLKHSRSEVEVEIMKSVKRTFDPKGILNPGVIFDLAQ
ncbi:MAG: FAD-binding oxidoreductase [Oceanobacter sp.]|jgi:FAD/FMN-containing dehydrogenase|nr:MAG: FAD-binding oxidoreductase [Oceanobacter sp.]|tara:strand:- start:10360 stop:11754 length:1395 start_codon:yes stop_codon:yes gene_type:complete